jgi:mannitol/fructose-specific phosphotransferase system IIA component
MTTATVIGGEEAMTDYQFKTIIKMVLAIARKTNDANTIIKELEKLLPESERGAEEE